MGRGKNWSRAPRIEHDVFVRTYLAFQSDHEVAAELRMKLASVRERASRLRKWGVKLPTRYTTKPNQEYIDELNELIRRVEGSGLVPPDSDSTESSSNKPSPVAGESES